MANVNLLADGGVVIAGLGIAWLLFVAIGLALSIFWIWMLIDCLSSNLPSNEKLIWMLVILFTHILGAALYFFMARNGSKGSMSA